MKYYRKYSKGPIFKVENKNVTIYDIRESKLYTPTFPEVWRRWATEKIEITEKEFNNILRRDDNLKKYIVHNSLLKKLIKAF